MTLPAVELYLGQWDEDLDVGWLSPEERSLYDRFLPSERRRQFLLGRKLVKEWTMRRLSVTDPRELSFLGSGDKKPRLCHQGRMVEGIDLNLSHAHTQVVLAALAGGRVGVDIEEIRERKNLDGMTDKWFSEDEKQDLEEARGQSVDLFHERWTLFWTVREAAVKMLGSGIFEAPRSWVIDRQTRTIGRMGQVFFWESFKEKGPEECWISVVTEERRPILFGKIPPGPPLGPRNTTGPQDRLRNKR